MNQHEIDVIFSIISMIKIEPSIKSMGVYETIDWARTQLAEATGNYTLPVGMSHGLIVSKEDYLGYMAEQIRKGGGE